MEAEDPLVRSLLSFASVVEARDPYTGGHLWRVSQLARLLGEELGYTDQTLFWLQAGAFLHDLGKIAVPDAVLQKPGRLTTEEFAVIRAHPAVGRDLLRQHPLGHSVIASVYEHHERPDGRGYPRGLDGDDINPLARIVSVADAFDAMTSTRPYRDGMPIHRALSIVADNRGTQFDAYAADALAVLGRTGALAHVVGHSAPGLPLLACPACGPIIALDKAPRDGDLVACPACPGQFRLHGDGSGFATEFVGRTAAEERVPQVDTQTVAALLAA